MKKVISFAVNYPITIAMMVCAVLLLGVISFNSLSIDLFPDLNNPELYIEIKAGERPPEEMEKQYVENIESMSKGRSASCFYLSDWYCKGNCSV